MKKYLICLAAVAAAFVATSFTNPKKESVKTSMGGYKWYHFNGGLLEMCDPAYYSLDPDNFPDCPPTLGIIYCEIYALPSQWDPEQPDLSNVTASRMRPLL